MYVRENKWVVFRSLNVKLISTKLSIKEIFSSSICLLIFLLLIKLTATLAAFFIYAKVTPFLDAERYLTASNTLNFSLLFDRTLFTEFFYATLKNILGNNLAVHLSISALLAAILWYVLKSELHYINKFLLMACVCLPHFLIWTGIVGKEALAVMGFLLLIKVCVDITVWDKLNFIPLLGGLFFALMERPHYALAYIYLFLVSYIIARSKIKFIGFLSMRQSVLLFCSLSAYIMICLCYLEPFYTTKLFHFMMRSQLYFLEAFNANTTRVDIIWFDVKDFFTNLLWGVPISILGPTFWEATQRIVLLPVFLEGCAALILLIVNCYLLGRTCKKNPKHSSIIIWGFIPAVIVGLIINYPFGIFNVGSAIRYKQSLAPLFYFYPILLMGAFKRKEHTLNSI